MAAQHRTWIEISAKALRHNLAVFRRIVGSEVGVMPIVKSNAYGHGLAEVVSVIQSQRQAGVGVAYGQEALALRAKNYRGRILVLSFWQARELPELIRKNIELVVWDWASLESVTRAVSRSTKPAKIHCKLDSGTSRIGFLAHEVERLKKRISNQSKLRVVGVFSHLANSEERSEVRTKKQIQDFTTLQSRLRLSGRVERHLACTASIIRYPEARFGLVRLGIGLYGLWPSAEIKVWSRAHIQHLTLKPVLEWKARIAQIKTVAQGTAVGYGGTWVAKKKTKIATIPVGYGDGYRRSWSNRSWTLIRGRRAPVIGRVSMNLVTVDVTKVPNVNQNDVATLLGHGITADDLSSFDSGTINYEITSALHPAIPRLII